MNQRVPLTQGGRHIPTYPDVFMSLSDGLILSLRGRWYGETAACVCVLVFSTPLKNRQGGGSPRGSRTMILRSSPGPLQRAVPRDFWKISSSWLVGQLRSLGWRVDHYGKSTGGDGNFAKSSPALWPFSLKLNLMAEARGDVRGLVRAGASH